MLLRMFWAAFTSGMESFVRREKVCEKG